jgi:putative peptidoglycan lipid II flippase
MQQPIIAVAVGVALGGFIQFAFQLPAFYKNKYSLGPEFHLQHPGLKKMSLLVIPATMGMAVAQVNIVVSSILASFLPEGSITYLYYSMRLIQFPIGIFGVAMGMAVLPALSEHAVKGDYDRLRDDFSFALRLLFFIAVPAMAGLIALREPIVNILFQHGKFDYAATRGTSEALLFYAFGIWSIVGVRVVTSGFYSMQDTRTPVRVAVIALAANIVFSIILMQPLKHGGLALANSLASWINFALLFFFLRKKLKRIEAKRIARSVLKIVFASCAMGIAGGIVLHGALWQTHGNVFIKVFSLSGTIFMCGAVYFCLSYLMKSEELSYIMEMMRQKLKREPTEDA